MVSAKALAKQLSVLEIPDNPGILVYRSGDREIDWTTWESLFEALRFLGKPMCLVALLPGDDLTVLSDEELDRVGLQWKVGLVKKSD